jgi:AraC-like DNA-binding protein
MIAGSRRPMTMAGGPFHAHPTYEFVMPAKSFHTKLGRPPATEPRLMLKGHVFPINSGQPHGPGDDAANVRLSVAEVDRGHLEQVANAFGYPCPVELPNENFPVDPGLTMLLRLFREEAAGQQPGHDLLIESLSITIVGRLLSAILRPREAAAPEPTGVSHRGISAAADFIREDITRDYSLAEVAAVAGMSPYHFIRIFKTQLGKAPHEYLTGLRIARACELLRSSTANITEVCFACGFASPSHFAAVFRQQVGVSPSRYRRALH